MVSRVARYAPSAAAAEPVAGSSGTLSPGTKTRARMSDPSSSGSREKTSISGAQYFLSDDSQWSSRTFARRTASRSLSGMIRKGSPHDTACGASMPPRMSLGSSESMSARIDRPGAGGPTSGRIAVVSWANTGLPARTRMSTGTGPTPSSSITRVSGSESAISPRVASTKAAPTVGCPAKGISAAGVKIRRRRVCASSDGG